MNAPATIQADWLATLANDILAGRGYCFSDRFTHDEWLSAAECALAGDRRELERMAAQDYADQHHPRGDLAKDGPDFHDWFVRDEQHWLESVQREYTPRIAPIGGAA